MGSYGRRKYPQSATFWGVVHEVGLPSERQLLTANRDRKQPPTHVAIERPLDLEAVRVTFTEVTLFGYTFPQTCLCKKYRCAADSQRLGDSIDKMVGREFQLLSERDDGWDTCVSMFQQNSDSSWQERAGSER